MKDEAREIGRGQNKGPSIPHLKMWIFIKEGGWFRGI